MRQGVLDETQASLLWEAILSRKNILVAGGTGSGKTTFTNALLSVLATTGHRVMLIEDTPELSCDSPNMVAVRVNRQAAFDYQRALFVALRMRPDRLIVGELRDGLAALELLKAWNTGHAGGMTTLHANSARACLMRLEQLLQEQLPQAPKGLIAQAVDLVVYIERVQNASGGASRRVRELVQVHDELDAAGNYHTRVLSHSSCSRGGVSSHTT